MNWFVASSIVVGFLLFGNLRRVGTGASRVAACPLAVVIPARNEAAVLPALLADLAASHRRPDLVVVVDDDSDDGTGEVARAAPGIEVVGSAPLPAGWLGKPWACHQGASVAISRLGPATTVVFLDADVRLAPGALGEIAADRDRHGGVVSVQPFHEVPSAREQLSGIFNLVSMMGIGAGTAHPTAMFGPVICCTADDLRRVDGHRSVRAAVTEDVALAHRFLEAGIGVRVLGGGSSVGFRMYPAGWRSLVEGWTKNIATGSISVPWWRTAGVTWWLIGLMVAAIDLAGALLGSSRPIVPAVAAYVGTAVALGILLRRIGSFHPLAALLHPVLVGFFVAVFARSAWCTTVRRRVTWKGRTIDLGDPDPTPLPRPGRQP